MDRFKLRPPSPALIVATGALFMALAGGAYAVPQFSSRSSAPTPVVRSSTRTVPAGTGNLYGWAASCPAGMYATGGGVGNPGLTSDGSLYIATSIPSDIHRGHAKAWYAEVENDASGPINVHWYVVCER